MPTERESLIKALYKFFRFILFPIIIIADFFQNNFTKYFTPMNMGPVTSKGWSDLIRKFLLKNDFVLDYGCGVGYFCRLFNHKKYIGLDINKSFIKHAKKINRKYVFKNFQEGISTKNKKKINAVLLNNVVHHLSDTQVAEAFLFFRNNTKKKTKILIIEPLFPTKFFALEFFMKVIDIGNYIKNKKEYLEMFSNYVEINKTQIKKFGIGTVLIIHGYLIK